MSFVEHRMQIFIKTLTGRKQALNFEPENTVLEVKQALQEKEGIQVDQIRSLPFVYWRQTITLVCLICPCSYPDFRLCRLIFSGKQLSDEKTLSEYNVAAGGTIHMVLQLRGGFI